MSHIVVTCGAVKAEALVFLPIAARIRVCLINSSPWLKRAGGDRGGRLG
jgi:hypothetical protein